ncbi:SAM-dependent methyltransferase [Actinomadura syzygii]|uniref:SAM-dependent methyltransferase n=1 Tax=Actinomadura syzygii TaxID=1427538 RepID=UPI0016527D0E|nr:SAM-dependent methyltransferase [Actinomadura syzygii]
MTTPDLPDDFPPGLALDFGQVSRAGVYNDLLGGKSATAADRETAQAITAASPDAPAVARENFRFAGRAASWAVRRFGIRQVFDIGVGIVDDVPLDSVESCVRAVAPDATVLAFDNDPVVLVHARALRRGYGGVLRGDVRDLDTIFQNPGLAHPDLVGRIDLSQPAVVVLAAVLHFVEDPAAVMAGLRERLAPGSVAIVSHATTSHTGEDRVGAMTAAYERGASSIVFRPEEEIAALADGWEIVRPPGLVPVQGWSVDGTYHGEPYETVRVVGMAAVLPGASATVEVARGVG